MSATKAVKQLVKAGSSLDELIERVLTTRNKLERGAKLTKKEARIIKEAEDAGIPIMAKEFSPDKAKETLAKHWAAEKSFTIKPPEQVKASKGREKYIQKRAGPKVAKDIKDYYEWKKSQTSLVPSESKALTPQPLTAQEIGPAEVIKNKAKIGTTDTRSFAQKAKEADVGWAQRAPGKFDATETEGFTAQLPTYKGGRSKLSPKQQAAMTAAGGIGAVATAQTLRPEEQPDKPGAAVTPEEIGEALLAKEPTGGRGSAKKFSEQLRERQKAEEIKRRAEMSTEERAAAFEQEKPEKEVDPLDQQIEEIKQMALQAGAKPTGAGVGSGEAKIRATGNIRRYSNATQIKEADTMAGILAKGLNAEQKQFYLTQLNNIRTQRDELFAKIEETKDLKIEEHERRELVLGLAQGLEMIGHGFTRLFAANYGMKKGVDMSGLKFDKFDWEATQARYDKRFTRIMEQLDKKQESIVTAASESEKGVLETMQKEEAGRMKLASEMQARADRLRLADQRMSLEADKAEMQFAIDEAKINAMKERNRIALEAAAAGDFQKAQLELSENKRDAISKLDTRLTEYSDEDKISRKEFAEITIPIDDELSKGGLSLRTIFGPQWEKTWAGWGEEKMSVKKVRMTLDQLLNTPGIPSPGAGQSGMPDILIEDNIDNLPGAEDLIQ